MNYQTRPARGVGPRRASDRLAQGLGWFSIGLGLAELFAAPFLCRKLGMKGREWLVRSYGARELATGAAILRSADPTPWIWARVGGDALDMATLAFNVDRESDTAEGAGVAAAAVAGVSALDVLCARALTASKALADPPLADYSNRSGFPDSPENMRGKARRLTEKYASSSPDMLTPVALRPWESETADALR